MTELPPAQPCRIYLVRHGTTLLNRKNRYRGRIDVALDEGGWRDAWAAAGVLGDKGIPSAVPGSRTGMGRSRRAGGVSAVSVI